jgi:hypothetical protein
LRDELLNGEIFYTLREAQIIAESWRRGRVTRHDGRAIQRCGSERPQPRFAMIEVALVLACTFAFAALIFRLGGG